jgi:hypothetical protein
MIADNPLAVWTPKYSINPSIARGLMQIEAARASADHTPLPPSAEAELRAHARVRAVHFSTYIEGNRLTMSQAKAEIVDANLQIAGLVHCQFVTIHPRHNYCFGRSEADLTPGLEYFISTLAAVFESVRLAAQKCAVEGLEAEPEDLRRLDYRSRVVLGLFAGRETIHRPPGGNRAWPLRAHGQKPSNRVGERWLAGGSRSLPPCSILQFIGKISAIHRQLIGNSSGRREQ